MSEVRSRKNSQEPKKKKKKKVQWSAAKRYRLWWPHPAPNEKTQPIRWTERPTGALVAVVSLWPWKQRRQGLKKTMTLRITLLAITIKLWLLWAWLWSSLHSHILSFEISIKFIQGRIIFKIKDELSQVIAIVFLKLNYHLLKLWSYRLGDSH